MSEGKLDFPDSYGEAVLVLEGIDVKIPASGIPCKAVIEAIRKFTASYEESTREHDYSGIRILSLNTAAQDHWRDEIYRVSDLMKIHAQIMVNLQEIAGEAIPENVRIALVVSHGAQRFAFVPFHKL